MPFLAISMNLASKISLSLIYKISLDKYSKILKFGGIGIEYYSVTRKFCRHFIFSKNGLGWKLKNPLLFDFSDYLTKDYYIVLLPNILEYYAAIFGSAVIFAYLHNTHTLFLGKGVVIFYKFWLK